MAKLDKYFYFVGHKDRTYVLIGCRLCHKKLGSSHSPILAAESHLRYKHPKAWMNYKKVGRC